MASQKAKQIDFLSAGLSDSSGQPYRGGKVYFWPSSSKTTPKAVYNDINKSQVLAQPIILGNAGESTVFGDGVYYIEVYDKNDVLVKPYDGYSYSASVDFGGLYTDIGAEYGTTGAAIQIAIDALNSADSYSFLFKDADFVISQNITFPANVVCHLWNTARFTIASGKNVKFEIDYVRSPGTEFFFGSGTVSNGNNTSMTDDTAYWGGAYHTGVVFHKNVRFNVDESSAASSDQEAERVLRIDATSGNKTVPLLTAVGQQGVFYTVIKTDSSTNTVTVDPDGAQTINGASTYVLYRQFDSVTFLCTGTGWEIVSFHSDRKKELSAYSINESFNIKHYQDVNGSMEGFRAQWNFPAFTNDKKVNLIGDGATIIGTALFTGLTSGSAADILMASDIWMDSWGPHSYATKKGFGQNTSKADFYWDGGAKLWAKITGAGSATYNTRITLDCVGFASDVIETPTLVTV